VTADRSTVENWVRTMEKAADEHDGGTWRAFTFRQVIAAAWAAGHGRGYDDCRDDVSRANVAAPSEPEEG